MIDCERRWFFGNNLGAVRGVWFCVGCFHVLELSLGFYGGKVCSGA